MTVRVQALIPYQQLVDQCWGILKQTLSIGFPSSSRSHPSSGVLILPLGVEYPWDFWGGVVAPTLAELIGVTPSYQNGWNNPMARTLVDGYLRKNLKDSSWAVWIDFSL